MADFVWHHHSLIQMFFILVMLTSSTYLTVYKKRHYNQLPTGRTRLIGGILLGCCAVFAVFCLVVMVSH